MLSSLYFTAECPQISKGKSGPLFDPVFRLTNSEELRLLLVPEPPAIQASLFLKTIQDGLYLKEI